MNKNEQDYEQVDSFLTEFEAEKKKKKRITAIIIIAAVALILALAAVVILGILNSEKIKPDDVADDELLRGGIKYTLSTLSAEQRLSGLLASGEDALPAAPETLVSPRALGVDAALGESVTVLNEDAFEALSEMLTDFNAYSGLSNAVIGDCLLNSDEATDKASLEHTLGYTFDLLLQNDAGKNVSPGEDEYYAPFYNWFAENCTAYGFILRFPADKEAATGVTGHEWQFRYVGEVHASAMKAKSVCLEEYLSLLDETSADGSHISAGCSDGSNWEIYRIPADKNGDTEGYLPEGHDRVISGDGDDGYIVAFKN